MRGPLTILLLLCCTLSTAQTFGDSIMLSPGIYGRTVPYCTSDPYTGTLGPSHALSVSPKQDYNWRRAILIGSLAFIAGSSWGVHETVVHHPNRIPAHWNQQYWNADLSWRNKYKNGSPAQGEAFPGSTTVLVWTTDAKHLFATTNRQTMLMTGMVIGIGCKRPWWHYAIDLGVSALAFGVGFHGTYSLGFRP